MLIGRKPSIEDSGSRHAVNTVRSSSLPLCFAHSGVRNIIHKAVGRTCRYRSALLLQLDDCLDAPPAFHSVYDTLGTASRSTAPCRRVPTLAQVLGANRSRASGARTEAHIHYNSKYRISA